MSAKTRFRNARGATGGKNDRAAERRSLTIFRNGDSPLPSARYRTNHGLAKMSSFFKESNTHVAGSFPHIHSAGECLPLPGPFGCREQHWLVMKLIEEKLRPQYLQVYCDFSLPS